MRSEGEGDEALWDALGVFEEALADGDLERARKACEQARALGGDDEPEVVYAQSRLVAEEEGLEAAEALLRRVVELDDTHADAHHDLALVAEMRGEREAMIERFQRVRVLDAKQDRAAGLGSGEELRYIEEVAREVLAGLPPPWGERLADVPVVLERHPSRELVAEGFDPRSLGLFDGRTHGDESTPVPTRIVLFTCNLLAEFPEEPELGEQIEITMLHEIGHFFGLDEDALDRLGLG